MTIEQQIGQMLLFGWQGATAAESRTVNDHASALIDDMHVGGVILMERNVSPPEDMRQTIKLLQARAQEHRLPPLFVATDQEGGRVTRLMPPDYHRTRSAWEIGETGDPEQAQAGARAIGEELRSVGLNWDFAPVLDVNNNPDNPVIGKRSYGSDAQRVAAMGVAAVQGFQTDAHILACGKHFPGHGDTDTDSHLALPTITHGKERLEQIELVPFRAAIAAGLAAIMTSHILFPALDGELPATLSPTILTGLLREEIGFDGLIITDCLEMRGVADGWGTSEAAILAVLAGADVLLCCHTWRTQRAIRDALVAAVQSGHLPLSRVEQSLSRIARAKARWTASP